MYLYTVKHIGGLSCPRTVKENKSPVTSTYKSEFNYNGHYVGKEGIVGAKCWACVPPLMCFIVKFT